MLSSIFGYISSGDKRSVKTKKNIIGSALTKMLSIIISLLLIPITINYVNPSTYGIWLTLSSIIGWITFFDIGISNGLRNKLAAAFACLDYQRAKKLVSTAYAYLIFIFIPLMIILLFINFYIDWNKVLNISTTYNLNSVMFIVICYFCINFILSTINIVLLADQRQAESSFRALIVQLISLVFIFILTKATEGSLFLLAIALCCIPLFVQFYYNIYLFRNRYKAISPSFSYLDLKLGRGILSLGFKFFIIQIAGIILFQTTNFIIIRYFGSQDVTSYNVAYKYFSILTMSMAIFLAPLWSAVTDAFEKKDINWIKIAVNKYLRIGLGFSAIGLLMLIFSNFLYHLWVGDKIKIGLGLSVFLYIFNVISIFGGIYCSVLNGTGRLKYQFIASIISPFIFLISSYILIIIFHFGIYSLVISIIIANFNAYILAPWEYYRYIAKNQIS